MKRGALRLLRLGSALLLLALLFTPQSTKADSPLIQMVSNASAGNILVNSQGMTLYTLSSDTPTRFACSGKCLTVWPPLLVPPGASAPTVGQGVAGSFGLATRSDGTQQVTYNGLPLYTFAGDKAAGDIHGEGIKAFGGVWHAATVTSGPLVIPAVISAGEVGTSSSFTVSFRSSHVGTSAVYFGSGPGCAGLVEVATQDVSPDGSTHSIRVTGNELPGAVGDNGLQPGATYWFEIVSMTQSGPQIDDNGGKCYSVTIPG